MQSCERITLVTTLQLFALTIFVASCGESSTKPTIAGNKRPALSIDTPTNTVIIPPGGSVNFTATATDPEGKPLTFAWDYDGGASGPLNVEDPGVVIFPDEGVYEVLCSATDEGNLSAFAIRTVIVTTDRALIVNLSNFAPFDGDPLFVDAIDATTNALLARILEKPLQTDVGNLQIAAPAILPPLDVRLNIWSDSNNSGFYEPAADAGWRLSGLATTGDVTVQLDGSDAQTDLSTPAAVVQTNMTFNFRNFEPVYGFRVELRVIEEDTGRTVGQSRVPSLSLQSSALLLNGILKVGTNYRADFYADKNADGVYNVPVGGVFVDPAWRDTFTATPVLTIRLFEHSTNYLDIGWVNF